MKNFITSRYASANNTLIFLGLSALLAISLFALTRINANAASTPLLDERILEKKAIAEAQMAGLQGNPTAKMSVQMTLEEWLVLMNSGLRKGDIPPTPVPMNDGTKLPLVDEELGTDIQLGLPSDTPLYVLAMRGDVISRIPGSPRPGQSDPERYDNITIVLDARTGNLIWVVTRYPGFPMPISVPNPSYP